VAHPVREFCKVFSVSFSFQEEKSSSAEFFPSKKEVHVYAIRTISKDFAGIAWEGGGLRKRGILGVSVFHTRDECEYIRGKVSQFVTLKYYRS